MSLPSVYRGAYGIILLFLATVPVTVTADDITAHDYQKIQVQRQDGVGIVKFDNPPRHTMDQGMVKDLGVFLEAAARDDRVRVIIMTGAGDKIFISHYDVGEIGEKSQKRDPEDRSLHSMHQTLLKIERLPKPVIAAINGRAHGGGYETALAADFRFLSTDGTVGLPETGIGIIPGGGGTQRLPRLIGPGKAKELIMLGKTVDAQTALSLGMVDHLAEPDALLTEATAFARQLAKRSPVALAAVKKVFREGLHLPMEEALKVEQKAFYKTTRSVDWGER